MVSMPIELLPLKQVQEQQERMEAIQSNLQNQKVKELQKELQNEKDQNKIDKLNKEIEYETHKLIPKITKRPFEKSEMEDVILSLIKRNQRFFKEYICFEGSDFEVKVTLRTAFDNELKQLNQRLQTISLNGYKVPTKTYVPIIDNKGEIQNIPQESEVYTHFDSERAARRARLAMYVESIGGEVLPDSFLNDREKVLEEYNSTLLDTIYENCLLAFMDLLNQSFEKFKVF